MFNLVVKDPITHRTRRTLSEHDEHTSRAYPSVLETFQTYREIRRAVNPTSFNREHRAIAKPNARDMPLRDA